MLAADTSGWIAQTVHTTPGATYLLRWEMAGNLGGPTTKTMDVFWQHRLVAKETFNTTGDSPSKMGWAIQRVTITAGASRSVVEFADATVGHANFAAMIDAVSLTVQSGPEVVNGFSVTPFAGPYGVAEREMLSEMKAHAVVPAAGTPICTLVASAADLVQNSAGLLIIWSIAPTAQFIHEASAARLASAQMVEQYLAGLLKTSRNLYLAALQANRVPLQGSADLAHWWGVEVQSVSTTGSPQSYQVAAKTGSTATETWSGVFGVGPTSGATQALANLLYYTKSVAAASGSTASTS